MKQDIELITIIGSGPAGYTAAIYSARANLNPLLYEGFFSGPAGGQLMTTTEVENFPGFPEGITGPELMDHLKKQATRFGTRLKQADILKVDFSQRPFKLYTKKGEILSHCVIIATGATAKKMNVPGAHEGEFWQKGVTACAVCDGAMPIFRDQNLFVIGGGDSAVEEAIYLTKYGKKVFIVHRRDELRASKIMAQRALNHPKISILWNRELVEIYGDTTVKGVVLENTLTKEKERHEGTGVFFAIGHQPNTTFLDGQLATHDNGYIKTIPGTSKTSIEGVFAAGDVQDFKYRQAITAAGSGCMAALDAEHYLTASGLI